MSSWKYSKERLLKHEYCAHIINAKKVICICGKTIKLNRRYEEDYLNRHAKSSGCKAKEGQRTIYNFFKPVQVENMETPAPAPAEALTPTEAQAPTEDQH
ncbi:hypothetical protein GLOIN_2v1768525 [Rhizophagus irregularis DAOM 181602=DAOM 197198]|uniref:Uncharacterized protein n=1 Tax=Rhizophagus irregularis (strain DAOM 181602 / DAOM 197198 / MUCL 43194) TaxID=747089 RepID=A0A2P4QGQ8_RHIID|nr:hypothetical protein GLOIN_2v1768525 [Rhizophagus irregularis DAOM 181602=DAOM 197198]POG76832.1 hypothetical protein GLOIN_2v1768525 [Rhizophagus irregularis DAOM 181602=DAOM 197198]|eukprot:XP_025183698.1 hypothetical protein GLOIN_2v1768525 [Rhizophagus irregularis DAOM 181602=DAOM 197198]